MTYKHRKDEFPDRNYDESQQIGWLADEIAELFPELVSVDKDGYQGVSYARAVVLLAQAFKELHNDYEQKISALESTVKNIVKVLNIPDVQY